jgi:hypothetical protein
MFGVHLESRTGALRTEGLMDRVDHALLIAKEECFRRHWYRLLTPLVVTFCGAILMRSTSITAQFIGGILLGAAAGGWFDGRFERYRLQDAAALLHRMEAMGEEDE